MCPFGADVSEGRVVTDAEQYTREEMLDVLEWVLRRCTRLDRPVEGNNWVLINEHSSKVLQHMVEKLRASVATAKPANELDRPKGEA